jgi:hypothetical protein
MPEGRKKGSSSVAVDLRGASRIGISRSVIRYTDKGVDARGATDVDIDGTLIEPVVRQALQSHDYRPLLAYLRVRKKAPPAEVAEILDFIARAYLAGQPAPEIEAELRVRGAKSLLTKASNIAQLIQATVQVVMFAGPQNWQQLLALFS